MGMVSELNFTEWMGFCTHRAGEVEGFMWSETQGEKVLVHGMYKEVKGRSPGGWGRIQLKGQCVQWETQRTGIIHLDLSPGSNPTS